MCVQAPPVVAGEAEEEIQRALYVGNYLAAVDAALQVTLRWLPILAASTLIHSTCFGDDPWHSS